jgi:hypothetical protein
MLRSTTSSKLQPNLQPSVATRGTKFHLSCLCQGIAQRGLTLYKMVA